MILIMFCIQLGITNEQQLHVDIIKQATALKIMEGGVDVNMTKSNNEVYENVTLVNDSIDFEVTHAFTAIVYDTKYNIPIFVSRVIQPQTFY